MPGKKMAGIRKPEMYEAMRKKGMPKEQAAKVSNAAAKKRGSRRKG